MMVYLPDDAVMVYLGALEYYILHICIIPTGFIIHIHCNYKVHYFMSFCFTAFVVT